MFKFLYGLAVPPFTRFIFQKNSEHRLTRSGIRGVNVVPRRKTCFVQTALAVKASKFWNLLSLNIRHSDSYRPLTNNLKSGLKSNGTCHHTHASLVCPFLSVCHMCLCGFMPSVMWFDVVMFYLPALTLFGINYLVCACLTLYAAALHLCVFVVLLLIDSS